MFNSMPKFVVSTTLKDPDWNNTTVLSSGDATVEVRKLKEDFDGELQVPGSHRLVQELIESDLVDQINLMVFPVILGTGKKAFDEKPERRNLRLEGSKVVGDGVAVPDPRASRLSEGTDTNAAARRARRYRSRNAPAVVGVRPQSQCFAAPFARLGSRRHALLRSPRLRWLLHSAHRASSRKALQRSADSISRLCGCSPSSSGKASRRRRFSRSVAASGRFRSSS